MPEIMKTDPAQAGSLEAFLEVPVLQVVVLERVPFPVAEHPLRNPVRAALEIVFPSSFSERRELREERV
jgi:hypothetical protein